MSGKRLKTCIVNNCFESNDEKVMLHIPRDLEIRKKWLEAVNCQTHYSQGTKLYVCEDHFDLMTDAENFHSFKVGGRLLIKPGVVPHLYLTSPRPCGPSQIADFAKKREKSLHPSMPGNPNKRRGLSSVSADGGKGSTRIVETPIQESDALCASQPLTAIKLPTDPVSTSELRGVIRYYTLQGKPAPDIFRKISHVYGPRAMTLRMVSIWRKKFLGGCNSLDDPRSEKPSTTTTGSGSTLVKEEPMETEITIKSEPPEFDVYPDDVANMENLAYEHDVEILPGLIKRDEDRKYGRKYGKAKIDNGVRESGKMTAVRQYLNNKRRKSSESTLPLETEITIEIKTEIKSEPPEFDALPADPLENNEESA